MRRYCVASTSSSVLSRLSLSLSSIGVGWVAAGETAQLHNALGVGCLAERGAGERWREVDTYATSLRQTAYAKRIVELLLERLDPLIWSRPRLTPRPHLFLERLDLHLLGAGDHKIVDVDTHQQGLSSTAPPVDGRLVRALLEAHPLHCGIQFGIPRPRCCRKP